jgi:hypothetical protein
MSLCSDCSVYQKQVKDYGVLFTSEKARITEIKLSSSFGDNTMDLKFKSNANAKKVYEELMHKIPSEYINSSRFSYVKLNEEMISIVYGLIRDRNLTVIRSVVDIVNKVLIRTEDSFKTIKPEIDSWMEDTKLFENLT